MLIVGDLSGIQSYLFDVAQEGGGQARRLRARSFYIQLLSECIAQRVIRAVGWDETNLVFSGAGKFILHGPSLDEDRIQRIAAERRSISEWLLLRLGAQLNFALALTEDQGTPQQNYERLMSRLRREKLRPWSATATSETEWRSEYLVLSALHTPCSLCGKRTAVTQETDERGTMRDLCELCHQDLDTGRRLQNIRWALVRQSVEPDELDVAGLGVSLHDRLPETRNAIIIRLGDAPLPAGVDPRRVVDRRLARHIPTTEAGQPVEFEMIAKSAEGDKLLGVLKADADSLGLVLNEELEGARDLRPLADFSAELDGFFGEELDEELRKPDWDLIYTVFSGGDDLILVGPWNVVVDFAGHLHHLFHNRFGARGMTISAAVSFIKYKYPIKHAAHQAEELLQQAKTVAAAGAVEPKDQFGAFGQLWKWKDHNAVIDSAKRLAKWVNDDVAKRGWLHTLLELALARHGDSGVMGEQATARLAYHVARNWPKSGDLRQWGNRLIADFDDCNTVDTQYLPAIARYALTATRRHREEE
jgi:CRISPR-associated protein Csm1